MRAIYTESLRNLLLGESFGQPCGARISGNHLSDVHQNIYRPRAV